MNTISLFLLIFITRMSRSLYIFLRGTFRDPVAVINPMQKSRRPIDRSEISDDTRICWRGNVRRGGAAVAEWTFANGLPFAYRAESRPISRTDTDDAYCVTRLLCCQSRKSRGLQLIRPADTRSRDARSQEKVRRRPLNGGPITIDET